MYKIFDNKITQLNIGDVQGKLFNTCNCDLTLSPGKLQIAPGTTLSSNNVTNMTVPVAFKLFDNRWFSVGGKVFNNAGPGPNAAMVSDSSTNAPTTCSSDYSDMENFDAYLIVATGDKLYSKASNGSGTGSYTEERTFEVASIPHPLCSYNNRIYWLDRTGPSKIYHMTSSLTPVTSGDYTMVLPEEYSVIWMRAFSNGIYIGTIHKYGGIARVFEWDGVTENKWNRSFTVYAQGALACHVMGDIPYIINSNGEWLEFTGSGFRIIGQFPYHRSILWKANNINANERFIHPNGLTEINGRLCALINNRNNNSDGLYQYEDNISSGIWEYEPGIGVYHKHALSYRINPSLEGYSVTDYGQITLERVGALTGVSDNFSTATANKSNFLAGAQYYSNATTSTNYGIWCDSYYDTIEKAGFFQTVKIKAQNFEDMWDKITTLYTPTTGFKFVVKYRTERVQHVDFTATWTSQTTFTTTQTDLVAGDEITIIQGKGSGRIAHISSVTGTGTFTITLDESITNVSGTMKARQNKWKKIATIDKTNRKFHEGIIATPDTFIELKVAMVGTGEDLAVEELILDNKKNK